VANRRYTRKEKVAAVSAAAASSVLAAAQESGIPESTLRYWWSRPEFVELRDRAREDTARDYTVIQHLGLARLVELIPTMDARDLTVLVSMAADKSQLLSGEATQRHETRTLTEGMDDHERDALRDAIQAELGKREVEA
jgi:transposase-like protein